MTPRITPPERSRRVSARVSMSDDGDDAVGDEVVAQRALGAPVARHRRLVADDEAGHLRRARLDVLRRHAVVADLRAGHRDDLSGVGRIGQHFLVAGHARVEHDLAARFAFRAGGGAAEPGAVFQCQNCFHSLHIASTQSSHRSQARSSPGFRGFCVLRRTVISPSDAVTRFCSLATTRTDDDQRR